MAADHNTPSEGYAYRLQPAWFVRAKVQYPGQRPQWYRLNYVLAPTKAEAHSKAFRALQQQLSDVCPPVTAMVVTRQAGWDAAASLAVRRALGHARDAARGAA